MTSSLDYSLAASQRRHVVVVGGGLAALRAAEELRRRSFDGDITMVCAEAEPPYDRPPLSKAVLTGEMQPEESIYRDAEFYREQNINLLLGHFAESLDPRSRLVHAGGKLIDYTDLIICTGAAPRRHEANNGCLQGIYDLRTIGDARAIVAEFAARPKVVVVGAGFIGAEVASSARAVGLDVTIIGKSPSPLVRAVGAQMGSVCSELHAMNGAKLLNGVNVASIEGSGRVERITLTDGSKVECDLLVLGIGVSPCVDWLKSSGVALSDGVHCDRTMATNIPNVYAAGDVASWENGLFGIRMRGEQWTTAVEQGRHVARQIISGSPEPYQGSTYFWSDQYGVRIQFAGVPDADEIVIIDGDTKTYKFLAWYRKGDRLVGALGLDSAKSLMLSKMLIEKGTSFQDSLRSIEKQLTPRSQLTTGAAL